MTTEEQIKVVMDSNITETEAEVTKTKLETKATEIVRKRVVVDTKYRLHKLDLINQLFTSHTSAALQIAGEVLPNSPIMDYLEELEVFDSNGEPFSSLDMKKEIILKNDIYSSKLLKYMFTHTKKNLETLFEELPKPLTPCSMCKKIPTRTEEGLVKCNTKGCYFHANVPPMDEETWNGYMNPIIK